MKNQRKKWNFLFYVTYMYELATNLIFLKFHKKYITFINVVNLRKVLTIN